MALSRFSYLILRSSTIVIEPTIYRRCYWRMLFSSQPQFGLTALMLVGEFRFYD
jgi:hypothetical protein